MTLAKKPVDWDELYPGRFLKAGEMGEKPVTLTIQSVDLEELEGENGKKIKGVLTFERTPKQIALNKTNGICLREMFGRKVPDWEGKRVTWFASVWNGEPCIRVYGSPDIERDMEIQVQLPKRKPIKMTLRKTQAPGRAASVSAGSQADREPGTEG